jgi:hypothetical protein
MKIPKDKLLLIDTYRDEIDDYLIYLLEQLRPGKHDIEIGVIDGIRRYLNSGRAFYRNDLAKSVYARYLRVKKALTMGGKFRY